MTRTRLPAKLAFFARLFLAFCILVLPRGGRASQDAGEIVPSYWKPWLLYLEASPHPRLYVEMDMVEGCAPSEAGIKKLRQFLTTYCHKPGGIEITCGATISRDAARRVPPEDLARKYMIGPPEPDAGPPAAFMYMLFYDGSLSQEVAGADSSNSSTARKPHKRLRQPNPRTDILPYPVTYMNVAFGPKFLRNVALLHEAGHMLGLVSRTNYSAGFHCQSPTCLMNRSIHLSRLALGLQRKLCKRCVAELEQDAKLPKPNLRFVGPVLIRSESNYSLISLPGRIELVVGDLEEQDCRDFARAVRGDDRRWTNGPPVAWEIKEQLLHDPVGMREILNRIQSDDQYDPVGFAASRASFSSRGVAEYFIGSNADLVAHYREALKADPQDGWTCDALAWLEATCPRDSIRNSKEALADATKACELSEWKNWNWIDTLAAACAENGDFQHAVADEEKALQMGHPNDSDRQAMERRLKLYQQSKPFRDLP